MSAEVLIGGLDLSPYLVLSPKDLYFEFRGIPETLNEELFLQLSFVRYWRFGEVRRRRPIFFCKSHHFTIEKCEWMTNGRTIFLYHQGEITSLNRVDNVNWYWRSQL